MVTIFLIILFITQIISFYLIALLYMKLSKFDDLKKRQSRIMKEMDDSIAAYLAEIKDENSALLEKLTHQVNERDKTHNKTLFAQKAETESLDKDIPLKVIMPQQTMRYHARKSYAINQQNHIPVEKEELVNRHQEEVEDDTTRAIRLSEEGLSIEEIAKKLDKGCTEIELILKFK